MLNLFKKRKSCKYCECGYPIKSERVEQIDMRVVYGHTLYIWQPGMQDLTFNIKYCPMCGRSINHQTEER